MIVLGIAAEHNSTACLMIDGRVVGMIQEERLTKRKNQVAFPLLAIKRLLARHLDGDASRIDRVVYGGKISDPFFAALDRYSDVTVADHIREMHELWHPHFYGGKPNNADYWREMLRQGRQLNRDHNFDFGFLAGSRDWDADIRHFCEIERPAAVLRHVGYGGAVGAIDHHTCHGYFAVYGAPLSERQMHESLILTADAWGDDHNWSASIVERDGRLRRISAGDGHRVARIYKYATLMLGMKPNEHEYKVMGLSAYSKSRNHIAAAERVMFEALDFRDGSFVSQNPLPDSYFALRERLEGHRFDNIAAALQNWASGVTRAWARHWLKETGKAGLCFSGGLSMNIKINGDLLDMPEVAWLSVPPSGGDESICAGACFASAVEAVRPMPMADAYLGESPEEVEVEWADRLGETDVTSSAFDVLGGVDARAAARLLAADCIVARCVGPAEFGARALGNRSILANPGNPENVKLINDAIKNRDFWMPFTPSILAEFADDYLDNPKTAVSPYMTIGFRSRAERRKEIVAGLHPADASARPQFVVKEANPEYWALIDAFRELTGVPVLLNTSLNLHGEPMNYTLADAARTVALSELDFLLMPGDRLLYKRRAESRLFAILDRTKAA